LDLYRETETSHHLQISRNDFLMSFDDQAGLLVPKQVEFNAISNSFVYLSQKMYLLHKYMEKELQFEGELALNNTLDEVVDAIAEVVAYYGFSDACMLMIVQSKEQNLFDQRGIEFLLWQKHGIRTVRRTLEAVFEQGRITDGHLNLNGETISSS